MFVQFIQLSPFKSYHYSVFDFGIQSILGPLGNWEQTNSTNSFQTLKFLYFLQKNTLVVQYGSQNEQKETPDTASKKIFFPFEDFIQNSQKNLFLFIQTHTRKKKQLLNTKKLLVTKKRKKKLEDFPSFHKFRFVLLQQKQKSIFLFSIDQHQYSICKCSLLLFFFPQKEIRIEFFLFFSWQTISSFLLLFFC